MTLKLLARDQIASEIEGVARKLTHVPVEARVWQIEALTDTFVSKHFVPTREPLFAILHVLAAQYFVQRIAQRHFARLELTIFGNRHREVFIRREVIRVLLAFLVTALQSRCEEVSRVGADLAAEEIERVTEPEVDVLLNDFERDATEFAHVAFLHQLRSAAADAPEARIADKHVMCFFRQHELARTCERLKARLGER